jgi:glycosyltransferase involved in cell wall biosynthesis
MRVAFDVGPVQVRPAGVGMYARSLAAALAEATFIDELRFIGRRSDVAGLPDHVPSVPRGGRMPYPVWAELLGGIDARRARADVAHFTDGLVPLVRSSPTVVTVHDLSIVRHARMHELRRLPRIPLVLASPHFADRVVADSTATADELIRLARVRARKIDVVMLAPRPGTRPVPSEVVRAVLDRYGLAPHRYVLAPGTLEPRKNHVRLIRAFTTLARQGDVDDDIQLVLVGGKGWGARTTLRAIAESPVARRIRPFGYVPDEDLMALMTGAAAVTYISTYEGFGLPILEAMACGAPVVTSTVSSMPEAAGGAAVLVDPFDVAAMGHGILEAMKDPTLPDASLRRAAQLSWQRTAMETTSVYAAALR